MTYVTDEGITKWSFRENAGQLWNTVLYTAALQPVSATSLTVNKIFFLINSAEILLKNRILLFYIYKLPHPP